jgi:hypothetical protein
MGAERHLGHPRGTHHATTPHGGAVQARPRRGVVWGPWPSTYSSTCHFTLSPEITSRFPWGSAVNGLVGQEILCKFLIASTYDYIRNSCLWLLSTRMLYLYLFAIAHVLIITWIILSMQRPFIHPYAYSIKSYYLLLIPLLSLFYYYCYYFTTATTIKLLLLINYCEQVYFQVQLNWQLIC